MRLDLFLYKNGNTKSRQQSKFLIENGNVVIDGKTITKPSFDVYEDDLHTVSIVYTQKYVSRGGEKLETALEFFNISVRNKICIDIGASTGGFTDCLLQNGAEEVYSLDAGYGQLDKKLTEDKRVHNVEKFNARFLQKETFDKDFDIAVMDVSFISQTLLHKNVYSVLKENGLFVSLIKPQFECGKTYLSKNGIVRDKNARENAAISCVKSAINVGFSFVGIVRSKIDGGDGNIEYLALFSKEKSENNYSETLKQFFKSEK